MIRFVDCKRGLSLADYEADLYLAPQVAALRQSAGERPQLRGRRLVFVNSTEHGGGVAEILPSQVGLLRDLDIDACWAVIEPDEPAFFDLTKRLHNALHGEGDPRLSADDRALFEQVSERTADALAPHLKERDLLVVHDPQPAGMGALLRQRLAVHAVWRCHIGLDERTPATEAAWDFLRPHVEAYDHAVFSLPQYVPSFMAHRASVIPPAIDPLSHKNRELSVHKLTGILANAALAVPPEPPLCEDFEHPARRLGAGGRFEPATRTGDLGLLFRPLVTQISRWDRLKGWAPLLDGFVELKRSDRISEHPGREHLARTRRRLELVRLVLAGPDPSAVSDDPGGRAVLSELSDKWLSLPPELQQDVILLTLPMQSRKYNALMVNALQRCSTVVVQNSLREGFGLTATEAMSKGCFVLATKAAGLRSQIDDGVHGWLIDDPEDPSEIAETLRRSLSDPLARNQLGHNARRRAGERYVTPTQLRRWVELLADVIAR